MDREMKMAYHKPKLTIHGSVKQITGIIVGKGLGPRDAQADPGSGILGEQ